MHCRAMHRFVGGLVEEKKDGLSLKRITMEETIGTPAVATPSSHLVEWVVTLSLNRQVKIYFLSHSREVNPQ